MTFKPLDEATQPLKLSIDGDMTISRATALKPLLLPALEHPGGLQLQLTSVTGIDTTGVQLLLSTQAALRALGRPFQLDGCSAPVIDALDLLGLRDTLAPGASDTFH